MTQARGFALVVGLASFSFAACHRGLQGRNDDLGGAPMIQTEDLADPPITQPGMPVVVEDLGLPAGCQRELCNNGLDDDCNGLIDDGCACTEGATESCFSGPPAARGVGICKDGTTVCQGGLEFTTWAACSGDVLPRPEECDAAGLDENCDGTINEGCQCMPGASQSCGIDTGECVAGTQSCVNGLLEACAGSVGPAMEVCNGKDDDCDGMTDEGLAISCGTSTGACEPGTSACVGGMWQACEGATVAAAERCNNIDDDCDGTVDDGLVLPCGTDTGECVAGTSTCVRGVYGACAGAVGPKTEICNNKDDDCDGMTDENLSEACGSDTGACQKGVRTCATGVWSACVGEIAPKTETCNGSDDDCDGMTDEGCQCIDGATASCGTDTGECVAGTSTCANGMWGACVGSTGAVAESCNNKDDDCDGVIDDGLVVACGTDVGACRKGTSTCAAGVWGACSGGINPTTEVCDGKDNNCDGVVDEGCQCTNHQTQSCGTDTGACVAGTQSCDNTGHWGACTGSVGPTTETCNNKDDDCDGMTDEALTQPCGTDTGECVAGKQTCSAGAWGACSGSVGPATEICNNKDDDCDGVVDDNLTRPCGTDVGACVAGFESCSAGAWGTCKGAIGPVTEICGNGIDDDCDGTADEIAQCPPATTPPVVMCPAGITTQPLQTVSLSGSGSDPDGGTVSYRWTVTVAPSGSSSQPANPNSASTTFFVDLAGHYQLTLTVTDNEGQTASCTVDITSVPPQQIHVELVWSTPYGDADLHMTQAGIAPATAWYMSSSIGEAACWYGNTTAAWPAGGAAGDATLDIDDRDGYGPENINIFSSPASGTYEIGVAYYCSHSVPRNPGENVNPGDGPTVGTVKVWCGGVLIATYPNINLSKTGQFVDVASVTWPGCTGKSVMQSTWTALVQPAYYTQPVHCPIACSGNSQCTSGEVCSLGRCVLQ